MVTQVLPGGGRNWSGGDRGSIESGRGTSAASERDSAAQPDSQRPIQGSASRGLGAAIRRVSSHSHSKGLSERWLPELCRCWVPNAAGLVVRGL
jgi:hypothetical protein